MLSETSNLVVPDPVLSPEQAEENKSAFKSLLEAIDKRETLLVVGAGSSRMVNYPTWSELLDELTTNAETLAAFEAKSTRGKISDLYYAQILREHIEKHSPGEFLRYLAKRYRHKTSGEQFNETHVKLLQLPFKGVLTTNYDPVLDSALSRAFPDYCACREFIVQDSDKSSVEPFLEEINGKQWSRRIAHLHGRFDASTSIVLSMNDYQKVYGFDLSDNSPVPTERTFTTELLANLAFNNKIVFAGFSWSDPFFKHVFAHVTKILNTHNEGRHFAIMGINQSNKDIQIATGSELRRCCSVQVVFCEELPRVPSALPNIVSVLHARLCSTASAVQNEKFRAWSGHQ